ncbi:MAG: type II secretion system secretin GspD [Phycisphaeraceae bacterium]
MHQPNPSPSRQWSVPTPPCRPTRVLLAAALMLTPGVSAHAQIALPRPAQAQPADAPAVAAEPADDAEPVADVRVSEGPLVTEGLVFNFDQATLKTVLNFLAEEAGLIIINEVELEGRITMFNKKPMSLDDAVDVLNTVLFEEEYTAVRRGRVLKVVSLEDAKSQSIPVFYGADPDRIPETDTIVTQVVPIRFANADEIQDDLEDLINDDFAEMTANASSNAIILTDTQANIKRIVKIISSLDQAVQKVTEVRVFKLDFADADDTARLIEATFQDSVSEDEVFGRLIQQRFGGGRGGPGRGGGDNSQQQGNTAKSKVTAEADNRTNSVVVSADPEIMVKIEEIIDELDADTTAKDSVLIYHVKNMQATDLADIFNNLFEDSASSANDERFGGNGQNGGRGTRVQSANAVAATGNAGAADLVGQVSSVANEDTNTVLILTPEKNFPRVQEILDELDRPVPQVLVRVLVSEVTYDDSVDFGVEWEGINVGSTTNDNIRTDFDLFDSTLGLNYLMFDGDNFRLAIRALNATGRFDVLSRPYLLTADNQEATINVGQRVPILTNSRVDENGDIISTIDYEDIGIILTVTPQINSEGLVVMDVSQEISSIADQAIPVAPDQNAVVFNQRELTTQVAVGHGQTVVIGGLVQDQLSETIRKVPIIGDIPLLGEFFKRTERSKVKTELLLFLTPEVIQTPDQLTPAAEKIKSESETLDNAVEPGRLQDHLDKLKATPGNDGPKAPETQVIPGDEGDAEADTPEQDAPPMEQDPDQPSRREQQDALLGRIERWRNP